jgi:DNA-binding transcriptional regulator YdaS (Cro superfamily)
MNEDNKTAIQRAADLVGAPHIAKACGTSRQAVYKWLRRGQAPTERCEAIERATGGRVSRFELLSPAVKAVLTAPSPRRPARQRASVANLK